MRMFRMDPLAAARVVAGRRAARAGRRRSAAQVRARVQRLQEPFDFSSNLYYEREYRCEGKPFRGRKSSYKTEEAGCKYEYEEDESGYKEKQDCKRERRGAVVVPGPLEHLPQTGVGYPPPRDTRPVRGRAPYGIEEGRCDRNEVGKVLGGVIRGVIGGIVGAEIGGDGDSRRVDRQSHRQADGPQ